MAKVETRGRLSVQQRMLLKGITSGLPISQAAREAGYTESMAGDKIYKALEKPAFRNALVDLMDREGLDDTRLLQALKDGLQAMRSTVTGKEVPDHAIRLKALDLCFKLRGSFAPERGIKATIDLGEILRLAQHQEG